MPETRIEGGRDRHRHRHRQRQRQRQRDSDYCKQRLLPVIVTFTQTMGLLCKAGMAKVFMLDPVG